MTARMHTATGGNDGFLSLLDELLEEIDEFEGGLDTGSAGPKGTAGEPDGADERRPARPPA